MKREKLTNREFDELAAKLLNSARPDEMEIERIASNPRLYEGVMAKIRLENQPVKRRFDWKPAVSASIAVLVVCFSIFAYFRFPGPANVAVNPAPPPQTSQPDTVFTPKQLAPPPTVADSRESAVVRQPRAEYAVMSKPAEDPEPRRPRTRAKTVKQPEPAFHPIGLREKAEDAAIDGRVVRVEMPRSALFALGVDVPLENGTRSIKADLLLGADGSPRAIRLVE